MSQDLAHSDVKTETLIRAAIHEVRAHGFGVGAFASSVMAFAMLPFTRAAMGPAGFFAQQALSLVGRQVAEHQTAENIYPGVENWPTLFFADDKFHTRMRNGYNAIRAECFDMRLYLPEEGQTLHTAVGKANIEKLSAVASAVGAAIDNWQKKRVVAAAQRVKDLAVEAERAKFLLPVAAPAPKPVSTAPIIVPAAANAEVPKGMSIVEVAQKGLAVKKAEADKAVAKPVATVNFAIDAKEAVAKKTEGLTGVSVVEVKAAPIVAPVVAVAEKAKVQPKPRLVMTQSGDVATVPVAAPVAPPVAVIPAQNEKVKEARKAAARKKLRARKQRKVAQNTVSAVKASGGVVAASAKLVAQSVETGVIAWTTNFAERLHDVRGILQEEAAQKAALAEQIKAKAQIAKQERALAQAEKDKQAAAQKLIAQAQAQAEAKLKAEQQAQEKLLIKARAAIEAEAKKQAKELAKAAAKQQAAIQEKAKAEERAKKAADKIIADLQARAKADAKARAAADARVIAEADKAIAKAKAEAAMIVKSTPAKQAVLAVPERNVVDVHEDAPVIVAVAAPVVATPAEEPAVAEAKRRINGVYNKTSNDNRTSKLPSLEKLAKGVVVSHR